MAIHYDQYIEHEAQYIDARARKLPFLPEVSSKQENRLLVGATNGV